VEYTIIYLESGSLQSLITGVKVLTILDLKHEIETGSLKLEKRSNSIIPKGKQRSIACIDTETATLNGEVYDVGIVFTNRKGKVKKIYEAIVEEVFIQTQTMKKAYYFNKVDNFYYPNVRCSRMVVKPWAVICKEVQDLFIKYKVDTIAAYNLSFDKRVLINTARKYGSYFVDMRPEKIDNLCLWRFTCETILQHENYVRVAEHMGWISAAGNLKTNAEVAYKFGFGEWEFSESHTALDDAMIETKLMAKLYALNQVVNYGILAHPWRIVNCDKSKILDRKDRIKKGELKAS
jgi:hypothetical protein